MFEEEMPESDSSDEDFVPTGERSDVSEEESDDAEPEEHDSETQNVTKKRKSAKSSKANKRKKKKSVEEPLIEEEEIEEKPKKEESPEEKKKKADALWADFLKDCPPVVKKKQEPAQSLTTSKQLQQPQSTSNLEQPSDSLETDSGTSRLQSEASQDNEKSQDQTEIGSETDQNDKVVEVYEFAGEKVVIEKKFDPRKRPVSKGGGAAAILSQLNKKNKLSTLEKSKLDWESFKHKEGINEQLSAHNRGKNGYLEKQDFLERADLRRFEIEKQMRAYNRSKRV